MSDSVHQRFGAALNGPDPTDALSRLAKELKAEGWSQAALYKLFVGYQQTLDGEDPRYDAVIDNLDLIWGGPWAKGNALFDRELTDADVK